MDVCKVSEIAAEPPASVISIAIHSRIELLFTLVNNN